MTTRVLLLAALTAAAASAHSTALRASSSEAVCWDPTTKFLCLDSWEIDSGNLAKFSFTCAPPAGKTLQWCAFGFNSVIPSPAKWGMAPAEVFMFVVQANGVVLLEDRVVVKPGVPACMPTGLSSLVSASVDAAGVLTASFTRPAILTNEQTALGYTSLNRTVPTIAALGYTKAQVTGACNMNLAYHDKQYNNRSIAFL